MQHKIEKSLFEEPTYSFKRHLEISNNNRILFSGKFGKGKTTFIKYFFSKENETGIVDNYFPIYLSPVNYSIASNEDILKYIKYDIILEFLKNELDFESFDLEFKESLHFYIYKNPVKVIGKLLSFIPYVGKELDSLYEKGEKLLKDIEDYKNSLKRRSEGDALEKYLESIETLEGSLYEDDFITKVIKKTIFKIKEEKEKEVVLIIDDLDRIDPEHIFRILNVFAAHFDTKYSGEVNKFGFNKVIVVCDLMNIRNIYTNRYGVRVDFLGYIDKFYSKEPFIFYNFPELKKLVDNILFKMEAVYNNSSQVFIDFAHGVNSIDIRPMIYLLLSYDIISLRSIINFVNGHKMYLSTEKRIGNNSIWYSRTAILAEIQIITALVGGYEATVAAFNDIRNFSVSDEICNNLKKSCNSILHFFATYDINITSKNESNSTYFTMINGQNIWFRKSGSEITKIEIANQVGTENYPRNQKDCFDVFFALLELMFTNDIIY